jgi:hypothetical protein
MVLLTACAGTFGIPQVRRLEKIDDPFGLCPADRRRCLSRLRLGSAWGSRGWKNWPRRGGIAERCNAEGRNRRKAKSGCQAVRAPGKGAVSGDDATAAELFRRRRLGNERRDQRTEVGRQKTEKSPCAWRRIRRRGKGCWRERKSWAQRKPLAGIPGSGFCRARLWSETPTPHLIVRTRGWRGFCRDEGASTKP